MKRVVKIAMRVAKWGGDVQIKSTGQYSDMTVKGLKKQLAKLKGKKPFNRKEYGQLLFALRAKTGWKKGRGATK